MKLFIEFVGREPQDVRGQNWAAQTIKEYCFVYHPRTCYIDLGFRPFWGSR
jgi:hypothetical protein